VNKNQDEGEQGEQDQKNPDLGPELTSNPSVIPKHMVKRKSWGKRDQISQKLA
jgi:hypothetical protein